MGKLRHDRGRNESDGDDEEDSSDDELDAETNADFSTTPPRMQKLRNQKRRGSKDIEIPSRWTGHSHSRGGEHVYRGRTHPGAIQTRSRNVNLDSFVRSLSREVYHSDEDVRMMTRSSEHRRKNQRQRNLERTSARMWKMNQGMSLSQGRRSSLSGPTSLEQEGYASSSPTQQGGSPSMPYIMPHSGTKIETSCQLQSIRSKPAVSYHPLIPPSLLPTPHSYASITRVSYPGYPHQHHQKNWNQYYAMQLYTLGASAAIPNPSAQSAQGKQGTNPWGCPQDRVEFYKKFSSLVRLGNLDRQGAPVHRQRSSEELVFLSELQDMLWLELQAWHAGRSKEDEDMFLTKEREKVEPLLQELLDFHYIPVPVKRYPSGDSGINSFGHPLSVSRQASQLETEDETGEATFSQLETSQEVSALTTMNKDMSESGYGAECETTDPGSSMNDEVVNLAKIMKPEPESAAVLSVLVSEDEETACDSSKPQLDLPLLLTVAGSNNPKGNLTHSEGEHEEYSCDGCLSVFCQPCVFNLNNALDKVKDLLDRIEYVEGLFPSSRALGEVHPTYKLDPCTKQMRTLCVWYNVTTNLRQSIEILGRSLVSMGARDVPWPNLETGEQRILVIEGLTPELNLDLAAVSTLSSFSSLSPKLPHKEIPGGQSKLKVKFDLSVGDRDMDGNTDECPSTNPSDSNASVTSSDSAINIPLKPGKVMRSLSETSSIVSTSSPYRHYVEKQLKTRGLKNMLENFEFIFRSVISRAYSVLHEPTDRNKTQTQRGQLLGLHLSPSSTATDLCMSVPGGQNSQQTASMCESYAEEFQKLGLPSFKSLYLFLCKVSLDIMYDCLTCKVEHQPDKPSSLSVRQLMQECKEMIESAVTVRQKFLYCATPVLLKADPNDVEKHVQDIERFDAQAKCLLEYYLDYMEQWVLALQREKVVSVKQRNCLEEEWNFVRSTCPNIRGGESLAAIRFCFLSSNMLNAIGDFLETRLDECTSRLYDSTLSADNDDQGITLKQSLLQACRGFQSLFHEAREKAIRAISFAKVLRKDLEIGAEYHFNCEGPEAFLKKLEETKHIRVLAPHHTDQLMFVPEYLNNRHKYILQLLDMIVAHDYETPSDFEDNEERDEEHENPEDGYLLVMSYPDVPSPSVSWNGATVRIYPTAENTIALCHLKVKELMLVVNQPQQLNAMRQKFQSLVGNTVTVVRDQTSPHQAIAGSVMELKSDALGLGERIARCILSVEEKLDIRSYPNMDENDQIQITARAREILHQCYNFSFEYARELPKLVTGYSRYKVGPGMIHLAQQWMRFVRDRCERGRGLRPRWANQGLNFLIAACEPQYLKDLKEEAFKGFQESIKECITHVIGSAHQQTLAHHRHKPRHRSSSPAIHAHAHSHGHGNPTNRPSYRSSLSSPADRVMNGAIPSSPTCSRSSLPTIPTLEFILSPSEDSEATLSSPPSCSNFNTLTEDRMTRIRESVAHLDAQRRHYLQEAGRIGHVTSTVPQARFHIKVRSVNFSWQKGFKIGQGRFGKVFTAVNNRTGELMAMKEVPLQPNDHQAIKSIAEEIRIFEGIRHPNLVRYHGVEILRDEMLIFMEYCGEGTLESLSESLQGLPESLIRRYTNQLLQAVLTLHEHGIVHRDIKGANIFLTDEANNLKLGDFGCAVKMHTQATLPGELQGFVGTPAFMAPEVISRQGGYGRAADIWSLGCVIIEMATGKRPWPDLENNYQIMFKVGMGEVPEFPSSLSEEGHWFLSLCLRGEPKARASAAQLLDHSFVKVCMEDDYNENPNDLASHDKRRSRKK